jgi:tRNA A64-2'-O-ribosylphosphate transferase
MSQPISHSDIIFPHLSNTPNFSTTLSSLRRSALSVHNRLTSICADNAFVTAVSRAYGVPLVANERCGSWYIPPSDKGGSVYFKSTDGHMNEWSFSLRRLNLQIFDVVEKEGGCVIVDSTRRGKSMPDALSKTVPIWCCVMNRAVFGNEGGEHKLYSPPQAVSASEHAQMETRIDRFVQQFLVRFSLLKHSPPPQMTELAGHLQTQHHRAALQDPKTTPTNLGNPRINTPRNRTYIPGLPPHCPLHSFAAGSGRRSL